MQVWNAEQLIFIFWISNNCMHSDPLVRWKPPENNIFCRLFVLDGFLVKWQHNSCVKSIKRLMFDILFAGFPLNTAKSQILKHLSNLVWQQAWAPLCAMPRPRSIVAQRKKSWTQRPETQMTIKTWVTLTRSDKISQYWINFGFWWNLYLCHAGERQLIAMQHLIVWSIKSSKTRYFLSSLGHFFKNSP